MAAPRNLMQLCDNSSKHSLNAEHSHYEKVRVITLLAKCLHTHCYVESKLGETSGTGVMFAVTLATLYYEKV